MIRNRVARRGHDRLGQLHFSVNLIRRSKKDEWLVAAAACSVENIEGAAKVHVKIESRISQRRSYRHLGGEVVDFVGLRYCPADQVGVAYVPDGDLQSSGPSCRSSEPLKVMVHAGSG